MTKNNSTIQDKITQLRTQLEWFDGDEFVLEESIERFKQAETLAKEIEEDLRQLKNEVKVVKQSFDQ